MVELVGGYVGGDAVEEFFVGGGVVASAGVGCVVSAACGGGAGVEVGGRGEGLTD